MKHIKLTALVLALALLSILLAACSENPLKAASGTYLGQYTKMVGDDAREEEEFSLILKEDGTGTHARGGEEYKITWTLTGEDFTMQETFLGLTNDYTGTLKDGALHLFNGDPANIWTYEYVYSKKQ